MRRACPRRRPCGARGRALAPRADDEGRDAWGHGAAAAGRLSSVAGRSRRRTPSRCVVLAVDLAEVDHLRRSCAGGARRCWPPRRAGGRTPGRRRVGGPDHLDRRSWNPEAARLRQEDVDHVARGQQARRLKLGAEGARQVEGGARHDRGVYRGARGARQFCGARTGYDRCAGRADGRKSQRRSDTTTIAMVVHPERLPRHRALRRPALDGRWRSSQASSWCLNRPGVEVAREGDAHDVRRAGGRAEVVAAVERGVEGRVAMLGAGNWFGEMSIVDPQPRSATVRALADSAPCGSRRRTSTGSTAAT